MMIRKRRSAGRMALASLVVFSLCLAPVVLGETLSLPDDWGLAPLPHSIGSYDPNMPLELVAPHTRPAVTPDVHNVVTANTQFSFDLFAQLRQTRPDQNLFVSPLSISTALSMAYTGARGQTASQMASALHLAGLTPDQVGQGYGGYIADLNMPREGYELTVANRLFGQDNYFFHDEYLNRLTNRFQAPLERTDFQQQPEPSRTHINDWVAGQTHDRIKDLLPQGSVTEDTRLVLANAIYFNGKWKFAFDEANTQPALFHLSATTGAAVPTMVQNQSFAYRQYDGFQMLEMPYAGEDLSMVIMLPSAVDGLAALETSLTAEKFTASVAGLEWQNVVVKLPKFELHDELNLSAPLQTLGMVDAFQDTADFTGIAPHSLAISGVYHKSFIKVDESGTEAAAATAIGVGTTSAYHEYVPPPVFNADHPFLFALMDNHTGGILFMGQMADPGAASAQAPEPATLGLTLVAGVGLSHRRRRERSLATRLTCD